MKTLKDLFLNELADMYDAERRILKAFPKMVKAARCDELKKVLQSHSEESEDHVTKLEQIFQSFGKRAQGQTCEATVGLLKEASEIAAEFKGSTALDAALISAAQKVEHYEIASYGCLHEWAGVLGNKEAASLLKEILQEEKNANESLTELALDASNEKALGESSKPIAEKATLRKSPKPRRGIRPPGLGRHLARSMSRR